MTDTPTEARMRKARNLLAERYGDTKMALDIRHGKCDIGARHELSLISDLLAKLAIAEEALDGPLTRYTGLVNCGDCGNWNPETEDEVIKSRAALTAIRSK